MTTLTTAIQQALVELEKGDTLCEINAAHILRQALESNPVVLPEPVAYSLGLAKYAHSSNIIAANEFTPDTEHADEWENLYTEQQVRALLATCGQAQAVPVADCYSDDDGDNWFDRPDDFEFLEGRTLGEEFELQASIRSWTEVFRVTKVPDENSDDYEVEPVSMRTTSAQGGA